MGRELVKRWKYVARTVERNMKGAWKDFNYGKIDRQHLIEQLRHYLTQLETEASDHPLLPGFEFGFKD